MKIACVQMDVAFGSPEENFLQVEKYIAEAAKTRRTRLFFLKCGIRVIN